MRICIYVLGYNRPKHLFSTLTGLTNALSKYSGKTEFEVLIRIDGSKHGEFNQEILNVLSNFHYAHSISTVNLGLRLSILSVLTSFKESKFDSMILLEDDILIKADCLTYFDLMLNKYKDDPNIIQISAFSPLNSRESYIFRHPRIATWGWATWKDKFPLTSDFTIEWSEDNAPDLTTDKMKIVKEYMPDVIGLFDFMHEAKINAWSLDLLSYSIRNNLSTIYPSTSLIENIGMDGSGENCGDRSSFVIFKRNRYLLNLKNLEELYLNNKIKQIFKQYYSPSLIWKIFRKLYGN